jgi:hypothetical protein
MLANAIDELLLSAKARLGIAEKNRDFHEDVMLVQVSKQLNTVMEEQLRNPFQGKINQDRYRFAAAKSGWREQSG